MSKAGLAILILGMHRSGTSALTGLLNLLGVELGAPLIGARPRNPKGHWELEEAVLNHDDFLRSVDRSWSDLRPLATDWKKSSEAMFLAAAIRRIIRTQFSDSTLWGVKDPRLCLLLPLWADVLAETELDMKVILMLRHPLEVAASLKERNDFGTLYGETLWLRYVIDSWKNSGSFPRVIVTYDELLTDWRVMIDRIASDLGFEWPKRGPRLESRIQDFITTELRHHNRRTGDLAVGRTAMSSLTEDLYQKIAALARHPDSSELRMVNDLILNAERTLANMSKVDTATSGE